jgi:hypothetical protein
MHDRGSISNLRSMKGINLMCNMLIPRVPRLLPPGRIL